MAKAIAEDAPPGARGRAGVFEGVSRFEKRALLWCAAACLLIFMLDTSSLATLDLSPAAAVGPLPHRAWMAVRVAAEALGNGTLHTVLLLVALAELADLRYRLLPGARRD